MPDRVIYEYAIIRLVPKVERGEFLNVGVILLSKPKKYLGIKYTINEERLTAFSKDIDLALIRSYLQAWEWVCEGSSKGGAIGGLERHVRFRWLTADRSTIIQSSKSHPGRCNNLDEVLESLYERFVL